MESIAYTTPSICPETVEQFAFTNARCLSQQPKALVLVFHGLNMTQLRTEPSEFEKLCATRGVLTLFPYYGPWSWMNMESVRYVDDVVEAVIRRYQLPASAPIISTGGSMGGLSALIYTRYARRTPAACFANCPVCDLPFHATERPDLPRTVYLAFAGYECGLEMALKMHSPFHQAAQMPRIPYFVVHGTADQAVNIDMHSARFVKAMQECGHQLTYRTVEGMAHCDLASFPEELTIWQEGILSCCHTQE